MSKKKMKKLRRAVIKEELVALTGNTNEAIVLNQMIYWSSRVEDSESFIKEELDRARKFADGSIESLEDLKEDFKNGWIYKSSNEMLEETMLSISRKTMDRIFNNLVENEWLSRRRNPKFKWDKTWQYRVNLNKIQNDLLKIGYNLEGYALPDNVTINNNSENDNNDQESVTTSENVENIKDNADHSNGHSDQSSGLSDHSIGSSDHSIGHSNESNGHSDHAIPKITTNTTITNTTSDITLTTTSSSSKVVEEKEKINKLIMQYESFQNLVDFLLLQGISKYEITNTIKECISLELYYFKIEDIEKQFEFMMDKLEKGKVDSHKNFAYYFANGLRRLTDQSTAKDIYVREQEIKKQNLEKEREERLNIYYDWLEE